VRWLPDVLEVSGDAVVVDDERQQLQAPLALGTFQYIEPEGAAHQERPRKVAPARGLGGGSAASVKATGTGAISATNTLSTLDGTAFSTTTGVNHIVIVKGTMTTGATAGSLTIQQARVTAGSTATVRRGSVLKVRKVL